MKGFKEPGFQDRANASARARQAALEKLKTAPRLDEAELAARAARAAEKEAKAAAKREEARAAREEAKRLKQEERERAEQERLARIKPAKTEAELKAARDARYAARKQRRK